MVQTVVVEFLQIKNRMSYGEKNQRSCFNISSGGTGFE